MPQHTYFVYIKVWCVSLCLLLGNMHCCVSLCLSLGNMHFWVVLCFVMFTTLFVTGQYAWQRQRAAPCSGKGGTTSLIPPSSSLSHSLTLSLSSTLFLSLSLTPQQLVHLLSDHRHHSHTGPHRQLFDRCAALCRSRLEVIHPARPQPLNWSNCSRHNWTRSLWKEAEIDRNLN